MYCAHWLIIKLILPMARQNKANQERQTGSTERKKGRVKKEMSQLLGKILEDR